MALYPVAQRYPEYVKHMMWITLGICSAALFLSSFATQVWRLILLQGVVFGVAAGAMYAPVLIWIPDWFVNRRGLAAGLIFGGAGLAGFAFPLIMGYLLKGVGFRWTLRIWALALGVTGGLAILGVNPRVPIRKSTMPIPREPWLPRDLSHFKSPLLYSMLAISILQALSYFPVSILISTYTSSLSSATLPSTVVLAIFNVSSSLSYLLFGRISDSYPYPYIIFVSGLGSALAAFFVWGFASSLTLVFAFAAIFGGFSGGIAAIWPAAGTDIGGSRDHITSLAMGCFSGFKGIGATIGPIIAASLYDTQSTAKTVYGGFGFRKVEIFVGSMAVATSLSALILNSHSTSKKKLT
ncbi:MFS-type transporter asR1 [Psilocybe cubensis]|uniref:MFS-type transporter asR1 n=1 Tax=Psilocybe cubensis TaxID=181762 RepID=A0ACB8HHU1_PSICU|nr:MFS-type transporter asR1 [Psilocybe cubensis]KAH9487292.1 MFS-type transporter asR1 [Psilocybe cubensis]